MKATTQDFPDWLGPIVVKQLRQGLRAPAFEWSFILLQMGLVLALSVGAFAEAGGTANWSEMISFVLKIVLGAQLLVVTPARAFAELSGERKAGTLDLLLLSGLTPRRLVFGKWSAHLVQASLFMVAVLPYAVACYFLGSVDLLADLRSIGIQIALCAVLSACALAFSTERRRKFAIGFAVLSVLLLLLGDGLPPVRHFVRALDKFASFLSEAITHRWGLLLLLFDACVVCLGALELAARSIAPLAANPVAGRRAIALLALIPIAFFTAAVPDPELLLFQLKFAFAGFLVLCARDLFAPPLLLISWCRGFGGRLGALARMFFMPGAPSGTLFLSMLVVLGLVSLCSGAAKAMGEYLTHIYLLFIFAVAALAGFFVWIFLQFGNGRAIGYQLTLFFLALTAFVPMAAAVIAARDTENLALPMVLFGFYAAVITLGSQKYWRRYFELCRAPAQAGLRPAASGLLG